MQGSADPVNENDQRAMTSDNSIGRRAIEFFVNEGVITFGNFTLKSGRPSPYFFNTGSLCTGRQLAAMGRLYADTFLADPRFADATVLFGPAYKGIPIAAAAAVSLAGTDREEMRAVSDRKEAKTHGDASAFLGVLRAGDRAVILDDVITTGGAKLEAIERLRAAGCEPVGVIIAFDRGEPLGAEGLTAREAFENQCGLPVVPIATINDLIAARPDWRDTLEAHLASVAL